MIRIERHRPPGADDAPGRFAVGELVRHRRYGYRGVVVAADPRCRADEAWYRKNQTQPDRDQPWYHVLVDGSHHTTYAAESSLFPDPAPDPVHHPLVELFFDAFQSGHYVRNDRPWPSEAEGGAD